MMERHANYLLIGVVTTLVAIGGLLLAIWLSGSTGARTDSYRVLFTGPVRGLSKGAEVRFNGVRVGEIGEVEIAPNDGTKILVRLSMKEGTPVRVDSEASAESQGISGVSAIMVSAGTNARPLLRTASRDETPLIPAKRAGSGSLMESGGQLVADADAAIMRVNRLLSDRNLAQVSNGLADLTVTLRELRENRGAFRDVAGAAAKLDAAMTDVRQASATLRASIDGDGRHALADASAAAGDLRLAMADARSLMADLASNDGTLKSRTLPEIAETMRSLRETSEEMNRFMGQMRRDPRGSLLGGPGRQREIAP